MMSNTVTMGVMLLAGVGLAARYIPQARREPRAGAIVGAVSGVVLTLSAASGLAMWLFGR